MKKAEQIKIDNYQAHYNAIKGNISQANIELEKALKLAEESRAALIKADVNLLTKIEKLDSITRKGVDIENRLQIKEERLEKRTEKMEENEKKSLLLISKEEDKLKMHKEVSRQELSSLSGRISTLKDKEAVFIKRLISFDKQTKINEEHKDKLDKLTQSFQIKIKELEESYDKVSRETTKKKEVLEKELVKLEEKTEKEKEKAVTAHKSLADREAAAAVRERDNDILVARLRVLYRQFLPGKALKM